MDTPHLLNSWLSLKSLDDCLFRYIDWMKAKESCRLKSNKTKLQRAENTALRTEGPVYDVDSASKCRKSRSTNTSTQREVCFFCQQPPGSSDLHEAATFQLDEQMRACALLLEG